MKNIISTFALLCILLFVSPMNVSAQQQEITGVRWAQFEENSLGADEIYMYCIIVSGSSKKYLGVTFGYNNDYWKEVFLSGTDGKQAEFGSVIQIMNWLSARGWESIDYVWTGGEYSYPRCIMRKNIKTLSEIDRNRFLKDVGMKP